MGDKTIDNLVYRSCRRSSQNVYRTILWLTRLPSILLRFSSKCLPDNLMVDKTTDNFVMNHKIFKSSIGDKLAFRRDYAVDVDGSF